MSNVKVAVTDTAGKDPVAIARLFYRAAFKASDAKGQATVTVPANALIDTMIALQDAIEGEYGNLEWALAVQTAVAEGALELLDQARKKHWLEGDFDSEAAHHLGTDPYTYITAKKSEDDRIKAGRTAFKNIIDRT